MSARPAAAPPRSADLRLAALHVRTGAYPLARVELESLAGSDALDAAGVLDLAEVRWRTGDLAGAEAAAGAWLEEAGDGDERGAALANVICAEAAATRGDVDAASAFVAAAAAGLAAAGGLAALLAGIGARAPWPADAPTGAGGADPDAPSSPAAAAAMPVTLSAGAPSVTAAAAVAPPASAGPAPSIAAASLVDRGRNLLATEPERAAILLALALRADRAAAEAVLAALDAAEPGVVGAAGSTAGSGAAAIAFVRAEALRVAGRHEEARIAYASAERLALEPAEPGSPGSAQ